MTLRMFSNHLCVTQILGLINFLIKVKDTSCICDKKDGNSFMSNHKFLKKVFLYFRKEPLLVFLSNINV